MFNIVFIFSNILLILIISKIFFKSFKNMKKCFRLFLTPPIIAHYSNESDSEFKSTYLVLGWLFLLVVLMFVELLLFF